MSATTDDLGRAADECALEQAFERVRTERMAGLPILNEQLRVEALGFRDWQAVRVGALVTPWSINLVILPRFLPRLGVSLTAALALVFILNGLREIGEPARKSLIAGGFPPELRARAVGLYWGLRSFAFCPAPLLSYLLWKYLGPENTFLVGGALGMVGTAWFWLRVKCAPEAVQK